MKTALVLGALSTTVDGAKFTDLVSKRDRIVNNPFNQKLFAEWDAVKGDQATAIEVEKGLTHNLRKLPRVEGKGYYATLEIFSNTDCTGQLVVYNALRLNECFAGIDVNGHVVSARYLATEDPLQLRETRYYGTSDCSSPDIVEEIDLLEDLPFDENYEQGTCVEGSRGMITNELREDLHGIAMTHANGPYKCEQGTFVNFELIPDGVCLEDKGGSFMYSVEDCLGQITTVPTGLFTKKIYFDSACSDLKEIITGSEEFERCRFDYEFGGFAEGDESFTPFEFNSHKCVDGVISA